MVKTRKMAIYLIVSFSCMFNNLYFVTNAQPPNEEVKKAIKRYTESNDIYLNINRYLRGASTEIKEENEKYIKLIHGYLMENKLSAPIYVIRGISEEEAKYYESQQGKIIDKHGFLSTIRQPHELFLSEGERKSKKIPNNMMCRGYVNDKFYYLENTHQAGNFLGRDTILLILLSEGTCAVDISPISSSGPGELEVLIDYEVPLKIEKTVKLKDILEEETERSEIFKAFKKAG